MEEAVTRTLRSAERTARRSANTVSSREERRPRSAPAEGTKGGEDEEEENVPERRGRGRV